MIDVLSNELFFYVLTFLEDVDLQVARFANKRFYATTSDYVLWRHMLDKHAQRIAIRLGHRRSREVLADQNILAGGLVTKRLVREGQYIGPQNVHIYRVQKALSSYIVRRNVEKLILSRPELSQLKKRNIVPPMFNGHAVSFKRARFFSNCNKLEWMIKRRTIDSLLNSRVSLDELKEKGIVPVSILTKYASNQTNLLGLQLALDRKLKEREICRFIQQLRV